jgi:hypothetical protein
MESPTLRIDDVSTAGRDGSTYADCDVLGPDNCADGTTAPPTMAIASAQIVPVVLTNVLIERLLRLRSWLRARRNASRRFSQWFDEPVTSW